MSSEAVGWVFRHSGARDAAFIVHLAVADSVNDQNANRFWMSVPNLAKKTRRSQRSVQLALQFLETAGYLNRLSERPGHVRHYRFLFPDVPVVFDSRTTSLDPNERRSTPAVATGVQGERTASAANDSDPRSGCAQTQVQPKEENPPDPPRGAVIEVFDAWREATGHAAAKLDRSRRRVIESRLKDFSAADLIDAVRGWRHSPHHRGENDRRIVYNELRLLLRDAAHVEQFRDLERNGSLSPARGLGLVGSQPPPRKCPGGLCSGNTWVEDPDDPSSVVPCPACRPSETVSSPPARHLSSV